ncbi:MAG: hypothetical protein J3Q66DRAFT_352083 [Benniella sp.]|nr:MAG: hypothetical protein J3Q66DRAFT_352083 [Benniella sp.]
MRYNAKTKAWLELVPTNITDTSGLTGATDHTTNTMYVPFGYSNAKGQSEMLIVNLRTGDIKSDGRSYPMNQQTGYATAWNPRRKSLIYVSGDGVFEYTQKDGWKPFFSKGLGVPPVWGSCLVSVGGGTKMALFGGLTEDDAMIGDIYVLDLTMEGKERWTKAPVTSKQRSEMARQAPACGSTGDQVIISGGSILPGWNDFECPKQRTLVFDVKTMKWTNRYVAPGQK